jgi:hypothetical protein
MKGLEMIALKRSLLLAASILAVWASAGGIEPSLGHDKKQTPKLQSISVMTLDLWFLECRPDGSGFVSFGAGAEPHRASFKAGTLDFKAMASRIKELSDKEAVGIVVDGKVITSTLTKAGASDFKAKLDRIKELSGKDLMVFVRDGKAISFKANVECYTTIYFEYGGNQDNGQGQFSRDAEKTNEFLYKVFTAAINEKATEMKGKGFDEIWRQKPPAFMVRER